MVLCKFFSRTVGNCEETETTDGLERRPREPEESLLSVVDSVELLADDECLLSATEVGERLFEACSADGSQAGSCLNSWSILIGIHVQSIRILFYVSHAAIIIAPKKTCKHIMQCNAT